jgi:Cu(I)/Ag(I) efflux system membrane protein CusA/SilA
MIAAVIRWSIGNRLLVVLASLVLAVTGVLAVRATPVDAIPDLSDVEVVIRTSYPGQAPQIVEDQVTYPLTTTMLAVPGAKSVRGYSYFGDSFVYIIFEDGIDLYWARSRVLEYLSQVQGRLPESASSGIGPDATGVGWVYQYALVDRTGRHDLGELRSLQDWFLQFELKSVPGVAEVATVGGMVRQHQIVLDPQKMAAYGVSQAMVADAVRGANQESGGACVEIGEPLTRSRSGNNGARVGGYAFPPTTSAFSSTACSSTSAPAEAHSGVMFSASLWLMPSMQGVKIMAAGATRAI